MTSVVKIRVRNSRSTELKTALKQLRLRETSSRPGARIAWLGGGGRNKFWGGTRSLFCVNSRGAREIYPSLDQIIKVGSKMSKGFSGRNRKFKCFFRSKTGDLQKKKRSSSQKRHKIWCQSTKNTNLDLDLRTRSPEPVNFFGAQSSLGGHKQSVGGHVPGMPPRGAGSGYTSAREWIFSTTGLVL